jgi:methyltransferase (TIGR00027 family)
MTSDEPLVRHVSDTARWVASFRAQESARKDALFRDPFAARLAGDRGRELARRMGKSPWAFVARTVVFDEMIRRGLDAGADTVVNLAAGMDARPYRMRLSPSLRWIEVDLPGIFDEKEPVLAGEKPACRLERVRLDLADVAARRALFSRIGAESKNAVVVCEGLLVYLATEQVASLARDLADVAAFRWWIVDLVSPGLLRILQKGYGKDLGRAPLVWAPEEGPAYFEQFGWKPVDVQSMLKSAARIRRLPLPLRLLAFLPDPKGPPGGRPWGASVLLARV